MLWLWNLLWMPPFEDEVGKRKALKKHIRKELEDKQLVNGYLTCKTCKRRAQGTAFINIIARCQRNDCSHTGKPIDWAKTVIGEGNTEAPIQIETKKETVENEYEHQPMFEFIYKDKVK